MHNNLRIKKKPDMMLTIGERHTIKNTRAIIKLYEISSLDTELFEYDYRTDVPEKFCNPEE